MGCGPSKAAKPASSSPNGGGTGTATTTTTTTAVPTRSTPPTKDNNNSSSVEQTSVANAGKNEVATSIQIEKQLAKAARDEQKKFKLLLLGAGESGKSTILKQMRLLYGAPWTDDELRKYGVVIRSNAIVVNVGEDDEKFGGVWYMLKRCRANLACPPTEGN